MLPIYTGYRTRPSFPVEPLPRLPALANAVTGVPIWRAIWSTTMTATNRNNPHAEVRAIGFLNRLAGAAIHTTPAWRSALFAGPYKPRPPREVGCKAVIFVRVARIATVSWCWHCISPNLARLLLLKLAVACRWYWWLFATQPLSRGAARRHRNLVHKSCPAAGMDQGQVYAAGLGMRGSRAGGSRPD